MAPVELLDFVVITGFSGAGKSTAMDVFEDAGYFCVDNLPPEMIGALVELFMHEGSKVGRAAVVSDVRGREWFAGLFGRSTAPGRLDCRSGCCSSKRTRTPWSRDSRRRDAGIHSRRGASPLE